MSSQLHEYVPRRIRRRPRRAVRTTLVCLLVVLVTVTGAGFGLVSKFGGALDKTEKIENAFPEEKSRPVKDPEDTSLNILLLGADGGPAKGESEQIDPTDKQTDRRSDSMMLVHIPKDRKKVYVISLMRDLWIKIPGHGKQKLNAAMAEGGVPKLVETLEGRLNSKIDHVAIIDFQGFRDLTKAIGGVTVKNDYEFVAHDTDYHYKKGEVHLEGDRALRFVRERKSFEDGDYQRVRNQQKFLKAVFKKVLSPETMGDPGKLYKVVDSIAPYVTMDSEFADASYLAGLGMQMKHVRSKDIVNFTLPTAGLGTSPDGQSIVMPDEQAINDLKKALKNNKVGEFYEQLPDDAKGE